MAEIDSKHTKVASAGLFDLRYILAVLFGIYGIVVTVMGLFFVSEAELDKAAGLNVNLGSGIVMLAGAVIFALWAKLRPVRIPERFLTEDGQPETPGH